MIFLSASGVLFEKTNMVRFYHCPMHIFSNLSAWPVCRLHPALTSEMEAADITGRKASRMQTGPWFRSVPDEY